MQRKKKKFDIPEAQTISLELASDRYGIVHL